MARRSIVADLNAESQLRESRVWEAKIAAADARAKAAEAKRKQAEAELSAANERLGLYDTLRQPNGKDIKASKRKPNGRATAVLALGDWHIEETIDPATVNGLNEFNLEIAHQRVEKMFQRAAMLIDHERGLSKIDSLIVWLGGDHISGYIHPELVEVAGCSPAEAIGMVEDMVDAGLRLLRRETKLPITVPCSVGNHGRTTEKMRIATAVQNSFEWIAYTHLRKQYRNEPGFDFRIADGLYCVLPIQGRDVAFTHGHQVKYGGGVGGPTVPILRLLGRRASGASVRYTFFQHLHQNLNHPLFNLGNCLCGYGPFSQFVGAACTPPSQTLAVFDCDRPEPVVIRQVYCD